VGIALRARRETLEARVREADERANLERQIAARALAEERLRIAQELHDVVAHSMSVIAVQAGVGAHVLADRPEQARAALDAISATSRGTLTEMRRLLGVLRDDEGERSHAPAPGLADLPRLVEDVHAAGVPVELTVTGSADCVAAGVELSVYRVVQEALTNVIKHAGSTSRVDVTVRHLPGSLEVEVVDDGRGAASSPADGGRGSGSTNDSEGSGHGLAGMRERVEVWGGDLTVGPVPGGGYRVRATLPFGDTE
jgi:signal transduction histidine kinase